MDTEFKGTPGSWNVYQMQPIGNRMEVPEELIVMPAQNRNTEQISICWDKSKIGRNGGLQFEQAKANANLIAAAPELLEALQKLIVDINNKPNSSRYDTHVGKAKAAIAKALGN